MSKLFNFISWILLIGGLAGILLIGTDHLSEDFTFLVAAAMLLANWMKVLFLWRQLETHWPSLLCCIFFGIRCNNPFL